MKKYRIYGIVHNEKVIYVGLTRGSVERRFKNIYPHIPKEIKQDSYPLLLEETDDPKAEREWIKVFECCEWPLYNIQKGNGLDYTTYNRENQKKNYRKLYDSYYKSYWENYRKENREKYNEYLKNYMRTYKNKKSNV